MIIDTQVDVVFRCAECDKINVVPISVFDISDKMFTTIKSSCCRSVSVEIRKTQSGNFMVRYPCSVCGGIHQREISFYDMYRNGEKYCVCDDIGAKAIAFTTVENTEHAIGELEAEYDGLEDLFNASLSDDDRLLVEALNALNELAIDDKIGCECGNHNIMFELSGDNIVLKCQNCGKTVDISVDDIKLLQQIIDTEEFLIEKSENKHEKKAKILEFKTEE